MSANSHLAGAAAHEPYPIWPEYAPDEVEAAAEVLRSGRVNYWTGDRVERFERAYAGLAGVAHAVAVGNGTLALELALEGLGVGPGDEVVVPSRTFIATASAAVARGATPVVADIEPDGQNLTAETVEAVLSPRTRAVVAVHLGGWPCELDALAALCDAHGVALVEDCAQAHGARYRGRPVGGYGRVAAVSFCQDKIITTAGEGGMLLTDDEAIYERAWAYKDHGKSRALTRARPRGADDAPGFKWVHERFGSNWRLTELQAAVGLAQLDKLDAWVARRARNAARLGERLGALDALRVPCPPPHLGPAWYRLYAFVRPERLRAGWTRDRVLGELARLGVPASYGACAEIHREKAFTDAGLGPAVPLPVARRMHETSLAFAVHPSLDDAHMDRIADAVSGVLAGATR